MTEAERCKKLSRQLGTDVRAQTLVITAKLTLVDQITLIDLTVSARPSSYDIA